MNTAYLPAQISFKGMADHFSIAPSGYRGVADTAIASYDATAAAAAANGAVGVRPNRVLGLRGEDRFLVLDSVAGPGEPPLESRVPFSFYICRVLEDLRKNEMVTMNAGTEDSLERLFALSRIGNRVHRTLSRAWTQGGVNDSSGGAASGGVHRHRVAEDEEHLKRYVYDFTCTLLPSVRDMAREDQALYVLMLLDLAGPGEPGRHRRSKEGQLPRWVRNVKDSPKAVREQSTWMTSSLAGVHHRFWRAEHAIRLHLKLLDAVGTASYAPAVAAVESRLRNEVRRGSTSSSVPGACCLLDADLHISVVCAVQLALLRPESLKQTRSDDGSSRIVHENDPVAWASQLDAADRAARDLVISFAGEGTGKGVAIERQRRALSELEGRWAKLRLMKRFVVDVCSALSLANERIIEGLDRFREVNAPVYSKDFVLFVIAALSSVASLVNDTVTEGSSVSTPVATKFMDRYSSDALSRYTEQYLCEAISVVEKASALSGGQLLEQGRGDGEEGSFCASLIALLAGDTSFFAECLDDTPSLSISPRVFPREVACVRGLRRLRAMGLNVSRFLSRGLLQSSKKANGSFDNRLASCFVAAVEEDTTVGEVLLWPPMEINDKNGLSYRVPVAEMKFAG